MKENSLSSSTTISFLRIILHLLRLVFTLYRARCYLVEHSLGEDDFCNPRPESSQDYGLQQIEIVPVYVEFFRRVRNKAERI